MKQEYPVSLPRQSRTSPMSLSSKRSSLSFRSPCPCAILVSLAPVSILVRAVSLLRSSTKLSTALIPATVEYIILSCFVGDAHRFSVSVSLLAAGSERASVHKRVINYLRVGHVFPPCSPFSLPIHRATSRRFLRLWPTRSLVRHAVSLSDTLSPSHSVCTHALMLIQLNAPKPSRVAARFQKLRPITKRDPRGGHGRPRGK